MKKTLVTVVCICVVSALIVLSIAVGGSSVSPNQAETLKVLAIICACSIAYCFIAGEITHNYSQMDKLWSLLPIVYTWVIAFRSDLNIRTVVYALIVSAWGIRLTVNFARKGAYRIKFWEGNEDYRWSIVRKNPIFSHGFVWTLFNLLFISTYQNLLVLAICLPSLACAESTAGFGAADVLAAVLALAFLLLETVSDEYQWAFHRKKKALLNENANLADVPYPYSLGFNTFGPWAYMRHPNYLGEQGMWLSLYIFAIAAGVTKFGIFHITFAGPLLLVLLFMGSSVLGEKISSGKYPKYADYTSQVCKYIPIRKYKPDNAENAAGD
ncbi:MAG: DUF1295 domain-containing protein [Clostridia bacterium]|nr:DUF1295 domain-containing protein [Clostridia bacterium]